MPAKKQNKKGKVSGRQMRRNEELRSENRRWTGGIAGKHRTVKTKAKRRRMGAPGTAQGTHKVYDEKEKKEGARCCCGSCNRNFTRGVR